MRSSDRWWQRIDLRVAYDPNREAAAAGDLLVGIGQADLADAGAARAGSGIVLNHKPVRDSGTGRTFASLSDYVARADDATLGVWRAALPNGIRSVQRFVVEDASIDTCFALLLFAARVGTDAAADGALLGAVQSLRAADGAAPLAAWLDYVSQWEAGRYVDGADKRASVACQMSMLSHLRLVPPGAFSPTDDSARQALQACLTLLDAYLALNASPRDPTPPSGLSEYEQADAQLEFELQNYQLVLSHGIRTQLRLPFAGSTRRVLVDALFTTDVELSGILKVLARTDVQNTEMERGFAMLGIYRPGVAGTGNDMTLSVDPLRGLTLEALWDRLEAMEDHRWGADRPRAHPRRDIAKYRGPDGQPAPGAPDQPWYDERGAYTLLGAPKRLGSGELGSRLGWTQDVLPAVWDLYAPVTANDVEIGQPRSVAGRTVRVVRWRRAEASAFIHTPALHQWLAALSADRAARHPGEFVAAEELDVIALPGGSLIVHPTGATIFDDWTPIECDCASAEKLAGTLAGLVQDYTSLLHGEEFRNLVAHGSRLLQASDALAFRVVADLKASAIRLRARLLELANREAALPSIRKAQDAHARIGAMWQLPQARAEIWDLLARTDELITQAHALLQEKRQFFAAAVVSTAGLFVVAKQGIDVYKDWATWGAFEMALPVWRKLGIETQDPKAYAELLENVQRENRLALGTLVVMLVVFAVGFVLAWRKYFGPTRPRPPAPPA